MATWSGKRKRFFEQDDEPQDAKKPETKPEASVQPNPEAELVLLNAKAKVPLVKRKTLKVAKYSRGSANSVEGLKDKKLRGNLKTKEQLFKKSAITAAQVEKWLLPTEGGLLEADEGEETCDFTQEAIVQEVDILSSRKAFDLNLPVQGPYTVDYTHSGRYLLLGGRKGHLAMMDWNTSHLVMETQIMETTRDVKFLQNEQFFAAAQKKYIYIYDKKGAEVHCLKEFQEPLKLEFLRHHFLLVSTNKFGMLHYQDVSTGKIVVNHKTHFGRTDVMRMNPYNAVINLGHSNGTVTMWTPNVNTPVVSMLCHKGPVTALAVDLGGYHMVTAGADTKIKVWDIRKLQEMHSYPAFGASKSLDISQKGLLAVGRGAGVEIWKDALRTKQDRPYMKHKLAQVGSSVADLSFCPYEDVLGMGHSLGFSSMLVPGSGEPNFDTFVANPYQTTKQRRESEIHALLDKLQPEMIMLEPSKVGTVKVKKPVKIADVEEDEDNEDEDDEDVPERKHKTKGRSKPGRIEAKKRERNYASKRINIRQQNNEIKNKSKKDVPRELPRALARFNK